jgi:sugar O-acyltransferase (sialic acid O-acetyltransferase NeuD family)
VGLPWSGLQVISSDDGGLSLAVAEGLPVALGVGAGRVRADLLGRAVRAGVDLPPVVASTATVAPDVALGPGTVVLEHAHVGPACVVGAGAVVNTGAVVEHDCHVGDFTHVAPHATVLGAAVLGVEVLLGAGACVMPGVTVRDGATVGAGSLVLADVGAGTTVVGVPATTVNTKD